MIGLFAAILAGIAIGLARGGSLQNLAAAKLRGVALVFAGVILQVASSAVEHSGVHWLPLALVLAAFACVFGFAALNWRLQGMTLVAVGALMNLLVIAANRGMPVSLDALSRAGLGNPFAGTSGIVKGAHRPLTPDAHLRFLADIVPIRFPANVVSAGDIVIWAGLLLLIQHLMVGRRGRRRAGAGAARELSAR